MYTIYTIYGISIHTAEFTTTNMTEKECIFCEYAWQSRVEMPKACPRCKRRFDYIEW